MSVVFEETRAYQGMLRSLLAQERPNLPGYIVLARQKGGNTYSGVIEGSFSLDRSLERTQFFWTSDNATSNFGGSFKVDGKKNAVEAAEYWGAKFPDVQFTVHDVHADDLPVVMDWDGWRRAKAPSEKTLSGVVDKFGARNVRFYDLATLTSEPLPQTPSGRDQ